MNRGGTYMCVGAGVIRPFLLCHWLQVFAWFVLLLLQVCGHPVRPEVPNLRLSSPVAGFLHVSMPACFSSRVCRQKGV